MASTLAVSAAMACSISSGVILAVYAIASPDRDEQVDRVHRIEVGEMAKRVQQRRPAKTFDGFGDPPKVRRSQREGGPSAVVETDWADPDDDRPNQRQARRVKGWRTFDPLRRMHAAYGSHVTAEQIVAADLLRQAFDLASMGLSQMPIWLSEGVNLITHRQPSFGPPASALAQTHACRVFDRAMKGFVLPDEQRMIGAIILSNIDMPMWCRMKQERLDLDVMPNAGIEVGRLLAILERLTEHFDGEIREQMAREHVQGVA